MSLWKRSIRAGLGLQKVFAKKKFSIILKPVTATSGQTPPLNPKLKRAAAPKVRRFFD
jgi:hypothetical protein